MRMNFYFPQNPDYALSVGRDETGWSFEMRFKGIKVDGRGLLSAQECKAHTVGYRSLGCIHEQGTPCTCSTAQGEETGE